MSKLVHHQYWNPETPSLFGKNKANDRAFVRSVECALSDCPLQKIGTCTMAMGGLGFEKCPYGKTLYLEGPTKRSGKCLRFIAEHKNTDVPWLKPPPKKLAFVGDFVYLPYSHMNMCKEVPFGSHSTGFTSGNSFLPREHWTTENAARLVDFRPQAIFGGEIASYQKEMVPLFLLHLYDLDRVMWDAVVARFPQHNKPPDYVGRKAILRTLAHPIEWTTDHNTYQVRWIWNGTTARTTSANAYSSTWGKLPAKEVVTEVTPEDNATIIVQDNSWVTSETVIID